MRTSRRIVLMAASVALILLGLGCGSAQAARVGAVGDITWGATKADVDREIEVLRTNGARWIRTNVNWAGLEKDGKGQINESQLAAYDYAIDRVRAAGLEVLMPVSDGVPYWASSDPNKYTDSGGKRHWVKKYPPKNMADYGDIVRLVVDHFKPKGVSAYEIWNEPNHKDFWVSGPDPAAYVPMLQAGYRAVKAADPSATVLLGGLSKSDFPFLEGVYRSGGKGYFDAVAVHPYTYGVDPTKSWKGVNAGEDPNRISKNAFPAIQEIKRSMDAFGDGHKQVWLTEFGYSTTTGSGGTTEAEQAEYLTKAYRYVEQFPWVYSLFWYSARNRGDHDCYGCRFGLTTATFSPKPSLGALRSYAMTQAPPPGGGTSGGSSDVAPSVRLTAPRQGQLFRSLLGLAAAARDADGIARVAFRVDGRLVASDRSAPYAFTWRVPRTTRLGRHVVRAAAFDRRGSSASKSGTVWRVR